MSFLKGMLVVGVIGAFISTFAMSNGITSIGGTPYSINEDRQAIESKYYCSGVKCLESMKFEESWTGNLEFDGKDKATWTATMNKPLKSPTVIYGILKTIQDLFVSLTEAFLMMIAIGGLGLFMTKKN